MSKTQSIRDALAGGALSFAELHERVGGDKKKLHDLVGFLTNQGELSGVGRGDQRSLALRATKAAKKTAKPADKRRRKSARKARTYRAVRRRLMAQANEDAQPAANGNGALHRQHCRTTLAALESVLDLASCDPMVAANFASHKEAIELLNA